MALILVIDVKGLMRDTLKAFISRSGYSVITADDGPNGLLSFNKNAPDLVILGQNLAFAPGVAVADAIRGISKIVPIVIFSGRESSRGGDPGFCGGEVAAYLNADEPSGVLTDIMRVLSGVASAKAAGGLVLVADDDPGMRSVLSRFLTSRGHNVILAADGEEAERLSRERRPDIVLLDIAMPKKDGIEVLRELAPEMPESGFIMLTGTEDDEQARACLKSGAFDYVSKLTNLETLADLVKARLLLQVNNPG